MTTGQALAILLIVVLLMICGPMITIWALNTLFGLKIILNFWTWLATFWLGLSLGSVGANSRRKNGK